MDADFSWKINDRKALQIADAITSKLPPGDVTVDSCGSLVEFIAETAKVAYADVMRILRRILPAPSNKFTALRIAYALLDSKADTKPYAAIKTSKAHARIIAASASGIDTSNVKILLTMLLVSSDRAGEIITYQCGVKDCVQLQRKIYSGRSRATAGRSLLELVGCRCIASVRAGIVQYITADDSEKKYNKTLCTARVKADEECLKAPTCALCKERMSKCKLAVR